MANGTITNNKIHDGLLFMPDISGFTQFVSETEIMHSKHIVHELLEIIIESNETGLQLLEIEGDAIFFYRPGKAPGKLELFNQVEKMFIRFHEHLNKYNTKRICQCGACYTANNLSLKIITHYGQVSGFELKDHQKLFGREVIVLHRLLKNKVPLTEYLLLTEPLYNEMPSDGNGEQLPEFETITENYDIGPVTYRYADISFLKKKLPEMDPDLPKLKEDFQMAITVEKIIKAPMLDIYNQLMDISERPVWMEGVLETHIVTNERINKIGQEHECLVKGFGTSHIVTMDAFNSEDVLSFTEVEKKERMATRFSVYKESDNQSKVRIDILVRDDFFFNLLFNLFMKGKLKANLKISLENLESQLNS